MRSPAFEAAERRLGTREESVTQAFGFNSGDAPVLVPPVRVLLAIYLHAAVVDAEADARDVLVGKTRWAALQSGQIWESAGRSRRAS